MRETSPAANRGKASRRAVILLAVGGALLATSWAASWFGPTPIRQHAFFPLWLGAILVMNGLAEHRDGSSLLTRDPRALAGLFMVSIPMWWLFEAFNARLGNWHYLLQEPVGTIEYHLRATIAFSTVTPAIFSAAALWGGTGFVRRCETGPVFAPGQTARWVLCLAGGVMVVLSLLAPRYAFPLVWLGLYFLLDPIDRALGAPALSRGVARGDWSGVVALLLAGITCGLLWEGWNFWSMPKWVYTIPYLDRAHLFEMPLAGYGGYLPFALEIYALVQLANRLLPWFATTWPGFDAGSLRAPGEQ